MELTAEQLKDIEHLAGINYSTQMIAMYLDVDEKEFLADFNDPESKIRYHYDRGKLIIQAEIDKANLKRARDCNLTSIQQWKKDSNSMKIENYKKKVLFDQEMREFDQLQTLIEKGEVTSLPEQLVEFYEQIDFIRSLYCKYNSKNYIINMVRMKWPKITTFIATKLYYETLNFFNLNNPVKVEAWKNIYADRLDNAALICFEMNDFETFRRLTLDAAEMRGVGKEIPNQIPKELLERKPTFYITDPELLGITKVSRPALAEFIDNLDITEFEKNRVKREAQVIDVPFVFVGDEQEQDND